MEISVCCSRTSQPADTPALHWALGAEGKQLYKYQCSSGVCGVCEVCDLGVGGWGWLSQRRLICAVLVWRMRATGWAGQTGRAGLVSCGSLGRPSGPLLAAAGFVWWSAGPAGCFLKTHSTDPHAYSSQTTQRRVSLITTFTLVKRFSLFTEISWTSLNDVPLNISCQLNATSTSNQLWSQL